LKRAIDIGAKAEFLCVLGSDGSTVDDTGLVGNLLGNSLGEERSDDLVGLLRLFRGGDLRTKANESQLAVVAVTQCGRAEREEDRKNLRN